MRRRLVPLAAASLLALATTSRAVELKPLSAQDKAKVEEILKSFDPNTYEIRFKWVDSKGKVQDGRLGRAVGLGDVRQSETQKVQPSQRAIIFGSDARGRGNAWAAGGSGVVGFKGQSFIDSTNMRAKGSSAQQAKIEELNALLQKYAR